MDGEWTLSSHILASNRAAEGLNPLNKQEVLSFDVKNSEYFWFQLILV